MSGVLLLDVTCRPLRVIPVQRAVALLLQGRAEPMTDDVAAEMRSSSSVVDVPAVLRLGYAVKIPFKSSEPPCTRRGVLARDSHECQIVTESGPCNRYAETIDHVHPKSKGGDSMSWTNLVAACEKHNHKKADKSLSELGWTLKRKPTAPRGQIRLAGARGEIPSSWEPFLGLAYA